MCWCSDGCGKQPDGARYKCDSCYNFDLCEECFQVRPPAVSLVVLVFHKLTRLCGVCRRTDRRPCGTWHTSRGTLSRASRTTTTASERLSAFVLWFNCIYCMKDLTREYK